MPRLQDPKPGKVLKVRQGTINFTLWPMKKSTRRYGLQSRLFVTNPWTIIKHSIDTKCPSWAKPQAIGFFNQAKDYFVSANTAGIEVAKPVLFYYSFLNLAKAFVLTKKQRHTYDGDAYHGLKERLRPNGIEFIDAYLEAIPSNKNINVFDDFLKTIKQPGLTDVVQYDLKCILPQILQGHRLWCAVNNGTERFIPIQRIEIRQNSSNKTIWLALYVFEDDLARYNISRRNLLEGSMLNRDFHEVKHDENRDGRRLLKFEQINTISYTHRASDKVKELISSINCRVWVNNYDVPPYKTYYLYCCPHIEQPYVLPQLHSIYAIFYYFGSVTRYRPHKFNEFLSKEYGALILEIITNYYSCSRNH